ncbi:MAG: protein kinase, partial [Myxococcales bacterium]|nr:protein kinase [Myxococcales bacterium]
MSGRYQLVRKLATGGMAEVFLARSVGPGGFEKTLVVKRILPQLAERDSFVQMFFAEARVAAQLAHPNIVQIFDFGEDDGTYFIAMEFVDGVNLRTLAKWTSANEPIAPAVAAKLVSLAAEGLAWAHDVDDPDTGLPMGLVHRDVSADNIMVSRMGAVKLLDFGVVRVEGEDNGTRAGLLKGKVAYMPPEQIRGEPLDRRADVYALGVVLSLVLTGQRPWERPSEVSLMHAILHEAPTPLLSLRPDLPAELVDLVARAISPDPDARFPTCAALHDALERFISKTGPVTTTQLGQLAAKVQRAIPGASEAGSKPGSGSRSSASRPGLATPARPSLLPDGPIVSNAEPVALDSQPLDDAGPTGAAHVAITAAPSMTQPLIVDPFKTSPAMPAPSALLALRAKLNAEAAHAESFPPEPPTPPEATPRGARDLGEVTLERPAPAPAPLLSPPPSDGAARGDWRHDEVTVRGPARSTLAPASVPLPPTRDATGKDAAGSPAAAPTDSTSEMAAVPAPGAAAARVTPPTSAAPAPPRPPDELARDARGSEALTVRRPVPSRSSAPEASPSIDATDELAAVHTVRATTDEARGAPGADEVTVRRAAPTPPPATPLLIAPPALVNRATTDEARGAPGADEVTVRRPASMSALPAAAALVISPSEALVRPTTDDELTVRRPASMLTRAPVAPPRDGTAEATEAPLDAAAIPTPPRRRAPVAPPRDGTAEATEAPLDAAAIPTPPRRRAP